MPLSVIARLSCPFSASLLPNNLSYISECRGLSFVHKNQVVIVDTSIITDRLLLSKKPGLDEDVLIADATMVPFEENDIIAQAKWVQLAFGHVLVLVTNSGLIQIYNHTGLKLLHFYRFSGSSENILESLRGIAGNGAEQLFIGTYTGEILAFTVLQNQLAKLNSLAAGIDVHHDPITDIVNEYSNESPILVSADVRGTILIWNLATLTVAATLGSFQSRCNSVAVHKSIVVAGFLSGHVRVFDSRNETHAEITAHTRAINSVAIDPTGSRIVCVSEDTFVSVYSMPDDALKIECLSNLVASPGLLTGVVANIPCSTIAVSCYDSNEITLLKLFD